MNRIQYSRNSLVFDVLEFGPHNKDTIILLHGFPANAESWTPTAELLAARGYRVLAPNQRGYSKNARPKHRRDYRLSELVEDINMLLKNRNLASAHIVGHDWGGVVAWAFAAKYSQRTLSLTAISTPHPEALLSSVFKSRQLLLSWYMLFFQLPWLPEVVVKKSLKKALTSSGLPNEIATSYNEAMQEKALLTGSLNWYRALPFTFFEARKIGKITPKTLFIYGGKDSFLSKTAAAETRKWLAGEYSFVNQPSATHWIPEESPEWLADKAIRFIK